ncbi:MAG: 3-dehydroquinate synthase II [Deltaproteobacteria bacterium]|nr:MAG: 3-dehydroquinate synthase II [Deltaproteobacteria bacterium]
MKKIWVKAVPWEKKVVTTALESGADGVMVPKGFSKKVKELGIITTIAEDGDLKLNQDVHQWEIKGKEDETKILQLAKTGMVIVRTSDWTIIPLENLVAQTEGLIVEVKDEKEAQTVLGVLEKGVDGVLITTKDLNKIKKIIALAKRESEHVSLVSAKIRRVEPVSMGDRVCVDTCTSMKIGEGMLVGNSSQALFLVHSESIENPYVEPRPFRVNAGPVHAYIRVLGGKTRYLSELKAGDEVMVVDFKGKAQSAVVGRVKIEKRPLILVEGEAEGEVFSTILQNAETIRLTAPDGNPVSVVDLKKGTEVLVALEEAGRHFGIKVEETIQEK